MMDGAKAPRFEALDVLRGLAVLGMALSGMVPYRTLPAWMYHAQLPPPSRDFNPNIFGLTWVDIVFPMFLFAMGAAIPLALSRRIEAGETNLTILKGLIGRGVLLAVYALVGQHLRPFVLADKPSTVVWLISLAGFVLIGLILIRWPRDVPVKWRRSLTVAAWICAILIIGFWNYPDGTRGFANYRNDVILMVLANVAVSGGAVWLWTRKCPATRWAVVAALVALFLTRDLSGLGKMIWDWDPTNYLPFKNGPYGRFLPILYHFEYHKYLLIVLPATFVGDMVCQASSGADMDRILPRWNGAVLTWAGPIAILIACVGLMAREVVATTIALSALALAVAKLSHDSGLAQRLFRFAAPLLIVGLLCEPIGGGIRKDSATLSYFLVTSGLCCMALGSLAVAATSWSKLRVWGAIRDTGTNPIVGYLVITNLIWGIVGTTGLEDGINNWTQNPWILTFWALLKTVFVAAITAWFTRRKLFLRA